MNDFLNRALFLFKSVLAGQYAGAKNPRAIHCVFRVSMVLSMVFIITNWLVMMLISFILGVVLGYGLLSVWIGVAMMIVAIAALDLSRFIQGEMF